MTLGNRYRSRRWLIGFACTCFLFHTIRSNQPCNHSSNWKSEATRIGEDVIGPLALSHRFASAMRMSLATLSPQSVKRERSDSFRRILVREKVGLPSGFFPETFWEKQVLPSLNARVNIVDVGANVGQFALPNARRGHHVFSFEPNPETCDQLKKTLLKQKLKSQV